MVEGDVYFRCHLEVGGSEDILEAETHGGPTRALGGDNIFSGITTGVQETEGE